VLRHVAGRAGSRTAGREPRPGRRLAAAAATAAAVIAIVVAAALVTSSSPSPQSAPQALQSVPRYYMALVTSTVTDGELDPNQTYAVVRDTLTGKTLAAVRPPWPYVTLTQLSGANDGRTFVLAAQGRQTSNSEQTQSDKFYEARFNPSTDAVVLTPLTLPGRPVINSMAAVALSPDGTRLAVASDNGPIDITVYALPSGSAKTWPADSDNFLPFGSAINDLLSWSSTGMLAYGWNASVYLLNTNNPASQLLPGSRRVLCLAASVSGVSEAGYSGHVTGDGTTIIAPVRQSVPIGQTPPPCNQPSGPLPTPNSGPPALEEFSVTTGRATSVIYTSLADGITLDSTIYWSNSSGSVLVMEDTTRQGRNLRQVVGIFSGGSFLPIPGASGGWILGIPPRASPPTIVQMAF
jgi:hypothetical protein